MTERDALLTAVQERLERAQSAGDAAPLLEPAAAAAASALAAEIRGTRDPVAWHALGWLHWHRYQALPEGEDEEDLNAAVRMFLPFVLNDFGSTSLPQRLPPRLIKRARQAAGSALDSVSNSYDPDRIDAVVAAWRRIILLTPDSDRTGRSTSLLDLGVALHVRYRGGGALTDLDSAITATEAGIAAAPENGPAAERMLMNLGVLLQDRYLRGGSAADLNRAVEHFRAAVSAVAESSPDQQTPLLNLGNALRHRYERDGQITDLAEAITVTEQAIALDPADPAAHGNIGIMLTARFLRLGNQADIDNAVEALRTAVDRTPAGHPNRCGRLSGLSEALSVRHGHGGAPGDADEAIDLARAAADLAPRDHRGMYLGNLGAALVRRFHDTHQAADLEEATAATEAALTVLAADDPYRGAALTNLGRMLELRAAGTADTEDLDEVVGAHQRAVTGAGDSQVEAKARALADLAEALSRRAKQTGAAADADAAITAARAAALTTPQGHSELRRRLGNAGVILGERFRDRGTLADLDEAIDFTRRATEIAATDDEARLIMIFANLAALLATRFKHSGDRADIDGTIAAIGKAEEILSRGHQWSANLLSNLISARQHRFRVTGEVADLDAAIAAGDIALPQIPPGAPGRDVCVANLAAVLRIRYDHTRSSADLADGIARIEAMAEFAPADRELRPADVGAEAERMFTLLRDVAAAPLRYALAWLRLHHCQELGKDEGWPEMAYVMGLFRTCLLVNDRPAADFGTLAVPKPLAGSVAELAAPVAAAMQGRALDTEDPALITPLPRVWQRILDSLPEGSSYRPICLLSLGTTQWAHFRYCGGDLSSLDASVDSLRGALACASHSVRPTVLGMLAEALEDRYKRTGAVDDLTLAIDSARDAARAAESDARRADWLSILSGALVSRFSAVGALEDLDEAVEVADTSLELSSPEDRRYGERVSGLCTPLRIRYEKRGGAADLWRCIQLATEAASVVGDDSARAPILCELAMALGDKYAGDQELDDLNRAIDAARAGNAALAGTRDSPLRVHLQSILGLALRQRSNRTGSAADLDEAIALARAVLVATPDGHAVRALRLSHLADALLLRFDHMGAHSDLDEAVEVAQAGAGAPFIEKGARPMVWSCLGRALQTRFGRDSRSEDLDGAVRAFSEAASAGTRGYMNKANWLAALAGVLRTRARLNRDPGDLSTAITHLEDALAASPDDGLTRGRHAEIMGGVLRTRFELTGSAADLDAAIENLQTAVDTTVADEPDRATDLYTLGGLLAERGAPADREASFEAFRAASAVEAAPPSVRILAATRAAEIIRPSDPGQAAASLEAAIRILPEMAPRVLQRSDQQHALETVSGLAGQAAELILADHSVPEAERAERALSLLEAGRGVLLSQALETAADLTGLRDQHPELAARFERLRDQLDQPADDWAASARQRYRLAGDLNATLQEIRAQEGFGSFGLPPSTEELIAEAAHGPVVVFTTGRDLGYALLLTTAGVRAVELSALTRDTLITQVNAFHAALSAPGNTGLPQTLQWLWDSVAEPVLHALGYDAPPSAGVQWPRVWWVPDGLLSMLPLHAAGYHMSHDRAGPHDSVLDRVISSYAPTIRALRHARQRPLAPSGPLTALVVAMPTTPRVPGRLSFVPNEVEVLRSRLFQPIVLIEPGPGQDAASPLPTKANVLARLPGCPIAHFACHGMSNPEDPSKSGLLLHDHEQDLFTVASLTPVRLHGAQLAYLSACRTAAVDAATLADEAIHLVSAFQLAGYPHVIGTLWEINDKIAVDVADNFYWGLRSDQRVIDVRQSALALHQAIRAIRQKHQDSPALWAAYMHAGA